MTVTRIGARAYVGISGDVKPTSGVVTGAHFWERDTGDEYIYDGTGWGRIAVQAEL